MRIAHLAIASTAFLAMTLAAHAQPAPARPMADPRVLEGRSAPPASAQIPPAAPQPPSKAPPAKPQVAFVTRNVADVPMWVTLYQRGQVLAAGCVDPKAQAGWIIADQRTPITVRGQLTRKPNCGEPVEVLCNASMEREASTKALELRPGGAGGCAWQSVTAQPMLKGNPHGWPWIIVENKTSLNAWITVYRKSFGARDIIRTGCAPVGGKVKFTHLPGTFFVIRAEITRRPGCAHPLDCDTETEYSTAHGGQSHHTLQANAQRCWVS